MITLQPQTLPTIGTTLAVSGTAISIIGATINNLSLDHLYAMQIWRVSNIALFCWSFGLWRKYWEGGLSGAALCGMYLWFAVTNEIGLR